MKTEDALHINNYAYLAAITLLYYDWLVTLPDEIVHVWARPFGSSSCWFLLNRYMSILGNVAVSVFQMADVPESTCSSGVLFHQILLVGAQVVVCIILTIRTYALYNQSKRILALILTIALALFAISVWAIATQSSIAGTLVPVPGCLWATPEESAWRIAVAWEALFALDCLLFALTVFRTAKTGRGRGGWGARTRTGKLDLVGLVRRDGAMYFGAMALANLSNLLTFYLPEPLLRGLLSTFASAVSVSLASRLVLNLHSAPSHAPHLPVGTSSGSVTVESSAPPGIFTTRLEVADEEVVGESQGAVVLGYEMRRSAARGSELGDGRERGIRELEKEKRTHPGVFSDG